MPQVDLTRKFPHMTPVKSAPPMFRLNGCGVALYGRRDQDEETGTYVATWCIALLFIPLFGLRAYRVAPSPKGWYFLGREPLSPLVKLWNLLLLAAIAGGVALYQYHAYTSSPAYQAKQQMASAHTLVDQGHLDQAAQIYAKLAIAGTDQAENAAAEVKTLLDGQCQQAPLSESVDVVAAAAQIAHSGRAMSLTDVANQGFKLVAARGDNDPRSGVAILDTIRPLVIDNRAIDDKRLALLRKWAASEPNNLDVITPLASLLEEQGKLPEAKALLLPVKDKLANGEGARVLGSILGREGDYDGAYALLWPYVQPRLDSLHAAESAAENNEKFLVDREIKLLNDNQGPADFYERYKSAGKDQQPAIEQEYLDGKIRNDPSYTASQESLEREARVVPVALELGIVMLQRAQGQTDSGARKSQLESAEKVFLAIGGIAGQSDVYRLSLGQVDYWLGKQADGRKLFDEFLTAKSRDASALLQVANKFRELGADPDCRAMAEEAYRKASSSEARYEAAQLRAITFKDLDDQIDWLKRSDTAHPMIKASLGKAMGDKAFGEGRDEEAASSYRDAIAAYAAMRRSPTTLNETALAYYSLFMANGDHQALERCTDCFQQAVDLSPGNPILLFNAGSTLLEAAFTDIVGTDINLRGLHEPGSIELLGYLYRDDAERGLLIERVKKHPGIARGMSYLQKVMVLSPKADRTATIVFDVQRFVRDEANLAALEARIRASEVDTSDQLATLKEFIRGAKDQQSKTSITASLKRGQERLDAVRPTGGRTAAVALDQQVEKMLHLDMIDGSLDVDRAIALATEAEKVGPSATTIHTLMAVDLRAAARDLCRTDPNFDAFYKKYVRSLGQAYLLAAVAAEPGPFQQALLQNPHMRDALDLMRKEEQLFPDGRSVYDWAVFKTADPDLAANAAHAVRNSSRQKLEHSIETLLHPMSPYIAMENYWLSQINGDPAGDRASIRKLADAGIPLPVQP